MNWTRRRHSSAQLFALILFGFCQTSDAQSGTVRDTASPGPDSAGVFHHFFWDFRCRFGPAARQTRDLRIDVELGRSKGTEDSIIIDILQGLGYTVEQPVKF